MIFFLLWLGMTLISPVWSHAMEVIPVEGMKFPNDEAEGTEPVSAPAWAVPMDRQEAFTGYTELIPYALRTPNQLEAGSCLYMSLTGVAEFWLKWLNPGMSDAPNGPLDLSERYMMNLASVSEGESGVVNWRTDSIFLLNHSGKTALNVDYRFTKGWVAKVNGVYVPATPGMDKAEYSTRYNWLVDSASVPEEKLIRLPKFTRDILFADPASDQWNVGIAPADLVDRIKKALKTRKAPVHVIYNHYGYWHAVNIVGFDDEADTKDCTFVRRFMVKMEANYLDLYAQATQATNPMEKEKLGKAALKAEAISKKVNKAFSEGGGCHPKGMFYVRDSIYNDVTGPVYDYDPKQIGDEANYSKPIVVHEYDWIRYMANHVTQIYLEPQIY